MTQTKPEHVTYLGVPANVWEYRTARDPRCERVIAVEWLATAVGQRVEHPAGTIALRHVTGDGRRPDFQLHAETTVQSVEAANVWASERLRGA